jgi:hypothetical protein
LEKVKAVFLSSEKKFLAIGSGVNMVKLSRGKRISHRNQNLI